MSIEKVRAASSELFSRTAAGPSGKETTPTAITPAVIALCESLNTEPPAYMPVQEDRCGLYGFCNLGVLGKIKADGGTIRFGWIIWEYPGLYLTAEFHSVWVDSSGVLIDITPKPDGETEIVFASGPFYPSDFDFTKRPNSRRIRTYEAPSRGDLARIRITKMTASQVRYETERAMKKGMALEQWIELRLPVDPLPKLIDDYLLRLRHKPNEDPEYAVVSGKTASPSISQTLRHYWVSVICDAVVLRATDESGTLLKPVDPLIMGYGAQCTNPHRAMELRRNGQHKMAEILKLLGQKHER
jgi:hypothetical protein